MLLFINPSEAKAAGRKMFQYISCYSLSEEYMYYSGWSGVFQYISCYSLSFINNPLTKIWNVSIHLMLLFIPRFIGFSSSNSFYNTAKYKGLQDFYQPTSHFLFTQSKPGIPPYFQYFSFFMKIRLVIFITFHLTYLRNSPVMFSHWQENSFTTKSNLLHYLFFHFQVLLLQTHYHSSIL